jgi:hypothetical protein
MVYQTVWLPETRSPSDPDDHSPGFSIITVSLFTMLPLQTAAVSYRVRQQRGMSCGLVCVTESTGVKIAEPRYRH